MTSHPGPIHGTGWHRRRVTLVLASVLTVTLTLIFVAADSAMGPDRVLTEAGGVPRILAGPEPGVDGVSDRPAPPGSTVTTQGTSPSTSADLDLSQIHQLPPAGDGSRLPSPTAAPVQLRIPSLDVGGAVIPAGVEADGSLEIPGPTEVGWYQFGPAPGAAGSTVLAAHIGYDGIDGVFRHLSSIELGATVDVVMGDETDVSYTVTEVTVYAKTELPVANLFDEAGPERLVLITCGGQFSPSLRHYDSNIVVIATPNR